MFEVPSPEVDTGTPSSYNIHKGFGVRRMVMLQLALCSRGVKCFAPCFMFDQFILTCVKILFSQMMKKFLHISPLESTFVLNLESEATYDARFLRLGDNG